MLPQSDLAIIISSAWALSIRGTLLMALPPEFLDGLQSGWCALAGACADASLIAIGKLFSTGIALREHIAAFKEEKVG